MNNMKSTRVDIPKARRPSKPDDVDFRAGLHRARMRSRPINGSDASLMVACMECGSAAGAYCVDVENGLQPIVVFHARRSLVADEHDPTRRAVLAKRMGTQIVHLDVAEDVPKIEMTEDPFSYKE